LWAPPWAWRGPTGLSRRADIIGVRVSDTTAEIRMATARVMANSRNSRPTTSLMKISGISTAISDTVREMIVKPICLAPLSAASSGVSPSSTWRLMFSIITMASSTTKPVAMVRAIRVRLLMLKPAACITAKVPISDRGTATAGIRVAVKLRRNRKITPTTSATASTSSNCTSLTEAWIERVRSVRRRRSTEVGRSSCNWGKRARTRSAVSMTLAPVWRWMLMITAGLVSAHAARRVFSTPSTVSAKSPRRIGAPLRHAMVSLR